MRRRGLVVSLIVVVLLVAGIAVFAFTFNLSALESPGETEVWLATTAKKWLVARAVRTDPPPPAPAREPTSVASGYMQYGGSCATCHGKDGTEPAKLGLSMYPPAPALSHPDVQAYTDAELFWIVKHGIRHSGMPGFARLHSDEEIWHLVHYVRSLGEGQR